MKRLNIAAAAAVAVIFASCGGDGGSKNKYPDSELFGNVLALQCQYADQDSILKAEMEEAEKNAEWSESGIKKFTALKEKNKAAREENVQQLANAVEQAKASLIGHDIPFEVMEGTGYEVLEVKISDIEKLGTFSVRAKIRVIDESIRKSFDKKQMDVSWYETDAEGNDTRVGHGMQRVTFPADIAAGAETEINIMLSNHSDKESAQSYYNFGRLVFHPLK